MKTTIFFSAIIFSLLFSMTSCFYHNEDIMPEPEILQDSTTYFYYADSENYLLVNYVTDDSFRILKVSPSLEDVYSFRAIDSVHVWADGVVLDRIPSEFGMIDYEEKMTVPNLRFLPEQKILISMDLNENVLVHKLNSSLFKTKISSMEGLIKTDIIWSANGVSQKDSAIWYEIYFDVKDENICPEATDNWLIKMNGDKEDVYYIEYVMNTITDSINNTTSTEMSRHGKLIETAIVLK